MQAVILATCVLISFVAFAQAKPVWITLGESTFFQLQTLSSNIKSTYRQQSIIQKQQLGDEALHIVQVDDSLLAALTEIRHRAQLHGPGFMVHDSFNEARQVLQLIAAASVTAAPTYPKIANDPKIKEWLKQTQATEVAATITKLSDFKNRHYRSQFGVQASNWVKQRWEELAKGRNDITVEQFTHSFVQPSVILTIQGSDASLGTVVLGGHMDSTASGTSPDNIVAPGADDNASGIASLTEALRVLLANNFKPKHRVKFMAYAGEEGGLLGSRDIAAKEKSANSKITGVLQLDMTNYKGSTGDIYFMTDYTNPEQTKYLTELAKVYLPELQLGETKCGYACSDHASWYSQGFRASMPAEAIMSQSSRVIHSARDTLENADPKAEHALKFAKLALVFGAELGTAGEVET